MNWVDAMKRDRVEGQVRWACVPKSRDIGATWVLGAINQVHSWLFTDYYVGWVGANVISTVDEKGSSKSIMEKYRMLLNRLPKWMQPKGWDSRENNKTGFIKNPINGSEIAGIGGDSFGRGGRATEVIIDEWNHCEHPDAKISALSAVADNVFFVSTVYGTAHKFYEQVTSGDFPVFRYHWKEHPIKGVWEHPDGRTGWGWDSPLGAVYPLCLLGIPVKL